MPNRTPRVFLMVALAGTLASATGVLAAGEQVPLSQWLSPSAALSTSGDFATDAFSDPWDFSNAEDVILIDEVGTQSTSGVSIGGGLLNVNTRNGSTIRLLFDWPQVLPWGRDGWANPIDAGRYTETTFRICTEEQMFMAVRFENAWGQEGTLPFNPPVGCSTQHFDLTYQGPVPGRDLQYPFPGQQGPWAGPIVRFEIHRGGGPSGTQLVQLDWVRVHRADAAQQPPTGVPVPRVLTPNIEGGADYATVERSNPWDFAAADDVGETNQLANVRFVDGDLTMTTTGNDPFVGLALGPELNTDRYRRLTIDACYEGGFALTDAPGGGMNGRMAWMPRDSGTWTETQDFVVFPGCHRMTLDLVTTPPTAVHDEATQMVTGWRGMRPRALRFDLHEDRGQRNVTLREVKLADDAAFSSTYDISFLDAAAVGATTADIYVTTERGRYDGTLVARDIAVQPGVNSFRWDGTDAGGAPIPNGTYWVYVTMRAGSNVGTGYSTGPVRIEKPVAATPSRFVPLTPARILDTRTGAGGNIVPLRHQVFTELDVTGVGGVPETEVTAVVMNVTAVEPTSAGFITVWPSGEPRPTVSNLNFNPGQVVPNLVTAKVGANGRVNIFNALGDTSVVADVVGYYTTAAVSGGLFTPLTPARVLDTRDGTGRGGAAAPVGQGEAISVQVTGTKGVPPTGVSAVALNVTVDQPTGAGFVTTWPTGVTRPEASTHNFVPGLTVANLVLAKVGEDGTVSMFNSAGQTHLVADVIGYYSSNGGAFVPVTPRRLADTRDGTGGRLGPVGQGGSFGVTLATGTPVPANATGVVANVTAVNSTAPSFLTAWPSGIAMPLASTMNPRPGVPVPNQAYLRLGDGRLDVYNNSGSTDVVIDVFGYFG